MTQICVIDCGYWQTKFKWSGGELSFRSLVEKTEDKLNKSNTYAVNMLDQNYLVGDGASDWNVELDKTSNELHKVTVYTGLGLINDEVPDSFDIVVNYPLGQWNKKNKTNFEEFLMNKEFITLKINGVQKMVRIRRCTAFPQTVPVIYLKKYEGIIGLIDIGGLTVQGCIVKNMNLIRDSIFSENKGCIVIYNEIRKLLNKKYGINIQDYEMENIIENELVDKNLIQDYLNQYVFNLKQIMRKNGWNIELLRIIFTGGGSLVLKKYLEGLGELSDNPIMDNVLGLWEVAKICYE